MLSIKRLLVIISTIILLSCLFFLYTLNENEIKNIDFENNISTEIQTIKYPKEISKSKVDYYLVGNIMNKDKNGNNDVLKNIKFLFDNLKLNYQVKYKLTDKDFDTKVILIFCEEDISKLADMEKLVEFIKSGGKMILAAGLSEGNADAYLQPLLGIVEKTNRVVEQIFKVKPGFLPFYKEYMSYGDFNASTWITLREDATVYIETSESKIPIVYSYPFGQGTSMVINASFIEDKNCSGILCGALCAINETFVYPIIGTNTVYLENIPITTHVNDSKCMKLYAKGTEAYVLDEILPALQGISARNGIKYTISALTLGVDKNSFPDVSNKLFYKMSKSLLQYGGEIVFAGAFEKNKEVVMNLYFTQDFKNVYKNYKIYGFNIQSGVMPENIKEGILTVYPDVKIIRTNGINSIDKFKIDKKENGKEYTEFPIVSKGCKFNDGSLWNISSAITSYGILSHAFDVTELLALDEENLRGWEEKEEELLKFENQILKPTNYLNATSLTGNINAINSYSNLQYQYEKSKNQIKLYNKNCNIEQMYFVRTDKKIKDIVGAEFLEVSKNYYLIKVKAGEVIINLN